MGRCLVRAPSMEVIGKDISHGAQALNRQSEPNGGQTGWSVCGQKIRS